MHPFFATLLMIAGIVATVFAVAMLVSWYSPNIQRVERHGKELHVYQDRGRQQTFYLVSGDGDHSWEWADADGNKVDYDFFAEVRGWEGKNTRREKVIEIMGGE